MAETVVITTHDVPTAVRLRDAFRQAGFGTELLTAAERIADADQPALLILTGGLEEKRARRLAWEAEQLRIPVLAVVPAPAEASPSVRRRLRLVEIFPNDIDPEEVLIVGRRALERRRLRALTGIVGESEPMREAVERILQIAPVHSTLLITGESGTGKELVARGIHALSPRRAGPFVAANVAALPESLLESELFGHERGAFTGALAQRKGLFELADRGTLFLDEIGEMPLATQTKLLRVLEEREFMRVGGEEPIRVDVRVIAATNQDLRRLVETGQFRRDLYYRLNVLHIHLPPLRQRKEDIPLLVEAFIRMTAEEQSRPLVQIAPDAMRILLDYSWPGNIRELRNLVESLVVLARGEVVGPDDLPAGVRSGRAAARLLLPPPPLPARTDGAGRTPPEIEFIFRTLLQLRMDVDDIRRDFEEYRRRHPELPAAAGYPVAIVPPSLGRGVLIEDAELSEEHVPVRLLDDDTEAGAVVFRPGMTMQDLEKEAISVALKEVDGNRRRAAELLGIGERTLYRKIKEYGIPF
jgi:transcriptional regulator with PAS, ATPase and Fis domain